VLTPSLTLYGKIESADGPRDSIQPKGRVIPKEENLDPPTSVATVLRTRQTGRRPNRARRSSPRDGEVGRGRQRGLGRGQSTLRGPCAGRAPLWRRRTAVGSQDGDAPPHRTCQPTEPPTCVFAPARITSIARRMRLATAMPDLTRLAHTSSAATLHLDWISLIMTGCAGSRHGG
jgi:hypothetical protein